MRITRVNPMLKSLLAGIGVYTIIGGIIIVLFTDQVVWNLLGFVIGVLLSAIMVIHMSRAIDVSVHQSENEALKHTRLMYIVRIIMVVMVFTTMIIFEYANPVSALFGLFSLKFSAYFKLITIKFKK